MPKVQCEYCQKWMKSVRGLGNHLRQSEYCLKMKQAIESSPNVRDDLEQSGNDTPQCKKRPYHLDMETPETHMEHDGNVAKIGRGLGMDSVHKTTLPDGADTEIPRAKAHVESVECRQEAKDSMDWLPYRRVIGDEDYPMFGANANSSSDEEDEKVAAVSSGVEDESNDDEDESSGSGSDFGSNNGEDMTDEDRKKWQIRRKKTVLDFKDFATYSKQHVNGLNEIQSKAVKIMHKLIRKRAPLDTYEAVMRWHLLECGLLKKHESLGDCPQFITRQKLMKQLRIPWDSCLQDSREAAREANQSLFPIKP